MSKIEQQFLGNWTTLTAWAREYAAAEHPTLDSTPIGFRFFKMKFNEFFEWHEQQVEKGNLLTYGGMPFSMHNRLVCARKLFKDAEFYVDEEEDSKRLKEALEKIGHDKEN